MTHLTREQRVAAQAGPGPIRVVAGPGTGKTTVIVERFLRLVGDGVQPSQILLVTFTERAAREMRGRLEARLGPDAALAVGTFHAMAQQWLREDGRRAGVPDGFSILSGPQRWVLAYELLWRLGDPALVAIEHPEHQLSGLLRTLERLKQELISLSDFARAARQTHDADQRRVLVAAARLFQAYAAECRRRRLLDFDDLLERAVRLLESGPEVLARYRARYPWVLVDEYQDTNLAQERVVELLAAESGQVAIVGDDDQSIYRFRGASRASMDRFVRSFPAQTTVWLTQNRRSTKRIVRSAARLIDHNADRVPKAITSPQPAGPPLEVWHCPDAGSEAGAIGQRIAQLIRSGVSAERIAVLTRTNAVARPVAGALAAAGIAYRTAAWSGFFEQPSVKDLVAALRSIRSSDDELAAFRLQQGFGALKAAGWRSLRDDLAGAAADRDVRDLFFELMERSHFLDAADVPVSLRFSELIDDYCERSVDRSLGAFLAHLSLVELSGLEPDLGDANAGGLAVEEPAVALITIHQAKGLEFDAVFVPCLVEGRLPQPARRERFTIPPGLVEPGARGREDHLAEERRLCYVAITRARTHVYLSWAERYEGERTWHRSRFLDEILAEGGADVVERHLEAVVPPPAPGPKAAPAGRDVPATLSYSALSTYRECPRQHWFRYRRRLPVERTSEAHLGDAVHRALHRLGQLRLAGRGVGETEARAVVDAAWSDEPSPDERTAPVYRRLAEELVVGYMRRGGFDAPMFHVEHPFETPVDGFRLKGVIDRIDAPREPGGPHVLVDYKTGVPAPASRLRRDLQLALYAIGAKRELGLDATVLELEYLREGKTVSLPADDALLREAERLVLELGTAIQGGDFEPHPEPRRCGRCPYRLVCDASV